MRLKFTILKAYILSIPLIFTGFQVIGQQHGIIDTAFNRGDHGYNYGIGTANDYYWNDNVYAIGIQSNNKIILGGGYNLYNGNRANGIVRTFPNGRIDTTFQVGTGLSGSVVDIKIDSNDNIFFVGGFSSYNGVVVRSIVKLLPNGVMDTSFNAGTGSAPINASTSCLHLQNDGKIIIAGNFTSFNGVNAVRLVRLNTDGSVDTSFSTGTGANGFIRDLTIQPDGKVIIVGDFTTFNGVASSRIARIKVDGSLDTLFSSNIGIGFPNPPSNNFASPSGVDVQANGNIIVVGSFQSFNGTLANGMVRLFSNGTRDISFHPVSFGWMRTVEVLPNQFFVVTGSSSNINGHSSNGIFRFQANGNIDVSFKVDEVSGDLRVTKTQSGNRTFIGGQVSRFSKNRNIYRLRANGSIDTTFNLVTGFDGGINKILELKDGGLVVTGAYSEYNRKEHKNLVKIHPNGSIDTLFKGSPSSTTFTLAELDSGKILVGGAFSDYNGLSDSKLVRIFPNGNRDYSFIHFVPNQFGSSPREIIVQPDLKILVAASYGTSTSFIYNPLYRLNYNGTFDNSFSNTNLNGTVYALELQADGRILAGGDFTQSNGVSHNRLLRLLNNGSIDNSFSVGSGANGIVRDIKLQYDGKILVCGHFNVFNGQATGRLIRLLSNGQIDTSFNIGIGADSSVFSISLQSDEKIILTGNFSTFNGQPSNGVVRLNNNGSVDSTFFVGTGANDYVLTSTVLKNGDIMIGGGFTAYQGVGRNRIARLKGDSCIVERTTDTIIACNSYTWINGITYHNSIFGPSIVYQSANGCDSVHYLNLQIDTLVASASLSGFTLTASPNADSYQWIDCANDSSIAGATNQTFNPQQNGNYAVIITKGTCTDTTACLTVAGIGLAENEIVSDFKLYPNPTKDLFTIESNTSGQFEIFSSDGRSFMKGELKQDVTIIDLSGFLPGVYAITLKTSYGFVTKKLILQRAK